MRTEHLTPGWVRLNQIERLRRLDAASLKAAIGEYVDEREIKALLERRDRILQLSGAKAGS